MFVARGRAAGTRRRVLSMQRANTSDQCDLENKQLKKTNVPFFAPILNHYLCVRGSMCLFINRMGTGFRMAAGNERRQDKKTTA